MFWCIICFLAGYYLGIFTMCLMFLCNDRKSEKAIDECEEDYL